MTNLYWFCLVVGGFFVTLAAAGVHDLDAAHLEISLDADPDLDLPESPWRSPLGLLLSSKFWSFSLCFFGLAGLLLTLMSPTLPEAATLAIALTTGLLIGLAMATVLRNLRHREVDSLIRSSDLIGQTGTLSLPCTVDSRGKVRLSVKGTLLDLSAYSAAAPLAPGTAVAVLRHEGACVWVIPLQDLDASASETHP